MRTCHLVSKEHLVPIRAIHWPGLLYHYGEQGGFFPGFLHVNVPIDGATPGGVQGVLERGATGVRQLSPYRAGVRGMHLAPSEEGAHRRLEECVGIVHGPSQGPCTGHNVVSDDREALSREEPVRGNTHR